MRVQKQKIKKKMNNNEVIIMSQKHNFIKTTDQETADRLAFIGFPLVSQNNGVYTFLNQPMQNLNFEEIDKKKMAYTNTLNI
jgi:hypothetical protein